MTVSNKKVYGDLENFIRSHSELDTNTPLVNGKHCTVWTGRRRAVHDRGFVGYGDGSWVDDNGKRWRKSHHLAWLLHHGPRPDGICVLHDCDNMACVEIAHLHLGTQKDNQREARERGLLLRDERGRLKSPRKIEE